MKRIPVLLAPLLLAGCAQMSSWMAPRETAAPDAETSVQAQAPSTLAATPPPRTARTVDEFDTTSAADKAAAVQPVSGGRDLGVTIASLGAAGEPGFWLKTPLATEAGPGRVVYLANGKSLKVDLVPLPGEAGAGSRISLGALRVLEAPLTGLPELRVFALE